MRAASRASVLRSHLRDWVPQRTLCAAADGALPVTGTSGLRIPRSEVCLHAVQKPGAACDAVVLVCPWPLTPQNALPAGWGVYGEAVARLALLDSVVGKQVTITTGSDVPCSRVVHAPVSTHRYTDDPRRVYEAARDGVKRAIAAGAKRPALLVAPVRRFPLAVHCGTLGALEAFYSHLQAREDAPVRRSDLEVVASEPSARDAAAVFCGQTVCRDLVGSDSRRMAPPRFAEYLEQLFAATCVSCSVLSDQAEIVREYPCLSRVAAASLVYPTNHARVVTLEYCRPDDNGDLWATYYIVGKGICFDTGGADLKVDGGQRGMSGDKGGAAAVAGLMAYLAHAQPAGVRVTAMLALAVNDIGAAMFRADEVVKSRAGVNVGICNTDAEGRMAMVDLLCRCKEMHLARPSPNTHLLTVATLTGHAGRAVGPYSIAMGNGVSVDRGFPAALQRFGHDVADPWELSTLRREDFENNKGSCAPVEVLNAPNAKGGSVGFPRGHQAGMSFLMTASGLDKHDTDGEHPIAYTHCDIGGSAISLMSAKVPPGAPVPTLAAAVSSKVV
eukprot:TRINITY_DN25449_c0_g1_i1.p1 TRINITY_DN25449_c0_g1~~TRINITY_DN25449_c0_g1_i1.p1  ORF type:complete len:581 (+),score=171.76 TRINITY_DN25449_c0_g1_i1:72-1745(+)